MKDYNYIIKIPTKYIRKEGISILDSNNGNPINLIEGYSYELPAETPIYFSIEDNSGTLNLNIKQIACLVQEKVSN